MAKDLLTLHVNAEPVLKALDDLKSLMPRLLNDANDRFLLVFKLFIDRRLPGFIDLNAKPVSKGRAGHLTYTIYPSNSFLRFLSVLRARNIDYSIIHRRLSYHLKKSSIESKG